MDGETTRLFCLVLFGLYVNIGLVVVLYSDVSEEWQGILLLLTWPLAAVVWLLFRERRQ